MNQKKCTGPCGRTLDIHRANFGVYRRSKDGFYGMCHICRREYNRRKRAALTNDTPDIVLAHSRFRRGDICEYRGEVVRVSHGCQHQGAARIAIFNIAGRKRSMASFREFMADARIITPAARAEAAE